MRLFRRIGFLSSVLGAVACKDVTPPSTIPAYRDFVLESVAQSAVPTIISAGAGDTTHIAWSTLELDNAGHAVTIDHFIHKYLQYPPDEYTRVLHQAYRMKGDSIEIGSFQPCPPNAMCVGNVHGQLIDSTLAIAEWYNPYPTNPIIYSYHLIQAH